MRMNLKKMIGVLLFTSIFFIGNPVSASEIEEIISDTGEIFTLVNTDNQEDSLPFIPNELESDKQGRMVIGEDTRYQITDTTNFPFSTVVRIVCTNGSYGTGVMIGPDTVVTAAHVVYDNKQWKQIKVIQPAYNNGVTPFGTTSNVKNIFVYKKWFDFENPGYDLAVIKLNENIGENTGYLGFRGVPRQGNSFDLNLTGYPGEKEKTGKMYTSSGKVTVTNDITFKHVIDTTPGNSGSPMYGNDYYLEGVHTHSGNYGTRLNAEYFNFIKNVRDNLPIEPSKFKAGEIVRLGGGAKITTSWSLEKPIDGKYLNDYYRIEQIAPLATPKWSSNYQVLISSYSNDFRGWVYEQDLGKVPAAKFQLNAKVHLDRDATVASYFWSRRVLDKKYVADNYTVVDIAPTAESKSPYQYRLRHETLGDLWVMEQDLLNPSQFNKNETVRLKSSAVNAGSWSSNKKIEASYFQKTFTIVDIARAPQLNSNYQYRIRFNTNGLGDIWVLEQDLTK